MTYNLTIMTDKLLGQISNPDCSYLVGALGGEYFVVRWLITLLICYAIIKAVDKLAFEPFLNWIKSKLYKKSR